MTPSIQIKRLMELIEAEDAANGEVGCGINDISGRRSHDQLEARHTWAQPIWVLRGSVKLYVVQAANLDDAIAMTREQHPQDTLLLEVVKVGGVLAPNQVIAIEHADVNI
jgi:hypothetical protein